MVAVVHSDMILYRNKIIDAIANLEENHVLLKTKHGNFTAGNLLEQSKRLAYNLHQQGMRAADKIVIAAEPGMDFVIIMFATMMLRTQVAIIDPEMGRENYKSKLDQFNPQWVFLDARIMLLQEHPILRQLYFWWRKNGLYFPIKRNIKKILTGPWLPIFQNHTRLEKLLNEDAPKIKLEKSADQQDYLVTYTSGTTDTPKGVLHSIEALGNSIDLIVELIRNDEIEQTLATHLPHFMLIGACAGIGVKLWDSNLSPAKRIAFIQQHKITTLFAPPAEYLDLMHYCDAQGIKFPTSLAHVLLGSAPVHQAFLERLVQYLPATTKITCLYGMTENLVVTTIDGRQKMAYQSDGDPLGKPAPGVALKIAADGEILLQSNQLFRRYLHVKNRAEWHATGDLGYLDDQGVLILTGRKKEMIIRRNFNLYPALYEPTIEKISGVEQAIYVGRYSEVLADEEVFLIVEGAENLNAAGLRKQLEKGRHSIDKEAWPDHIIFRVIPRKGRQQKVDRELLKAEL